MEASAYKQILGTSGFHNCLKHWPCIQYVGEDGKFSLLLNSNVIVQGVYKVGINTEWAYLSALSGTFQQAAMNSVFDGYAKVCWAYVIFVCLLLN